MSSRPATHLAVILTLNEAAALTKLSTKNLDQPLTRSARMAQRKLLKALGPEGHQFCDPQTIDNLIERITR